MRKSKLDSVRWCRVFAGAFAALALANGASAADCTCKQLPMLEQELFEQEWLQKEFYEYALGNKAPPKATPPQTSADALAGQVLSDFRGWLNSPAGGGGSRGGAPELGTNWQTCGLVGYRSKWSGKPRKLSHQEVPFDEAKYRQKNCTELADYLIAHEQKHVDQCKKYRNSTRVSLSNWMDYAAFDSQAYGEGIKKLREGIAKLARKCGWQGSTNATKKNPIDGQEVDVVPTMAEAQALANALQKGKP